MGDTLVVILMCNACRESLANWLVQEGTLLWSQNSSDERGFVVGCSLSFSVFLSPPLSLSLFLRLMLIYGCFHPGFTTPSLSYPPLPPYCYHLSLHSLSCHFIISFFCNTFALHLNDSIISLLKMMRIVICSFLLHFFILFPSILGR